MKRRGGAITVDIDMIKQFVIIKIDQKVKIDFAALEDAVKSAGYKLLDLYIEATGQVKGANFLIAGSNQAFKIKSAKEFKGGSIAGQILGWKDNKLEISVGAKPKVSSP